jgi:hypothetical protein
VSRQRHIRILKLNTETQRHGANTAKALKLCLCVSVFSSFCLLLAFPHVARAQQQPSRAEALAAMKKATQFMLDKVSHRGGYVWSVSEDFRRRDGEVPARETQIWIQGGTPEAGHAYLDAYEATQVIRPFIEVEPIRREYERISRLTREQARAEYEQRRRGGRRGDSPRQGPSSPTAADVIKALDARGAWVTDISVLTRVAPPAMNPATREPLRGYSTGVFIRNMRVLTDYVRSLK